MNTKDDKDILLNEYNFLKEYYQYPIVSVKNRKKQF